MLQITEHTCIKILIIDVKGVELFVDAVFKNYIKTLQKYFYNNTTSETYDTS